MESLFETTTNILETSPTVLQVDSWGMRKGRELYDSNAESILRELTATEFADFYAMAFQARPEMVDNPADAVRSEWVKTFMASPKFKAINKRSRGRVPVASVAAEEIATGWHEFRVLQSRKEETTTGDIAKSVSTVLRRTGQAVDEVVDVLQGLGGGIGGDGPEAGSEADQAKILEVFSKIKSDQLIQKIMASAGKFRRVAQSLQRRKTLHGVDDMVGVTLGGNINRLCVTELTALADDDLEWLALQRIATNRAMVRDYRGVEPTGKGPIVVVVDESGSMHGSKIETAKGLALALGWIAQKQNRWISFIGYSGGCAYKPGHKSSLTLPPGGWDQPKLLEWLTHFWSGGTNQDLPVRQMVQTYWPEMVKAGAPKGKTDLVMITDALLRATSSEKTVFNAWKKSESVTAYGIVVGGAGDGGDFADLCDRWFTARSLETDGEGVEAVLSI